MPGLTVLNFCCPGKYKSCKINMKWTYVEVYCRTLYWNITVKMVLFIRQRLMNYYCLERYTSLLKLYICSLVSLTSLFIHCTCEVIQLKVNSDQEFPQWMGVIRNISQSILYNVWQDQNCSISIWITLN